MTDRPCVAGYYDVAPFAPPASATGGTGCRRLPAERPKFDRRQPEAIQPVSRPDEQGQRRRSW